VQDVKSLSIFFFDIAGNSNDWPRHCHSLRSWLAGVAAGSCRELDNFKGWVYERT
jgi:hypothetical protein